MWLGGVNLQAQTVTTASSDKTDVTIVTTAEGQIGKKTTDNYSNVSYPFSSGISEENQKLIKAATKLTIKGSVSCEDMIVLFSQFPKGTETNQGDQNNYTLTYLDMSEATLDKFEVINDNDNYSYRWSILPNNYAGWKGIKYLALPKAKNRTEVPGEPLKENGEVESNTNFSALTSSDLETVVIPDGYTSIGYGAFSGCTALSSVTLPEGLKTIGAYAFQQCKGLHHITFPESLERVEEYAFNLADLQGVIFFPQNVKYLGQYSFSGQQSESITDVYFQSRTAPETADEVFGSGQYAGYSGFTNPGGTTATRETYYVSGHKFCVLHYRPDLTEDERKTYWDKTRVYTYNDLYLGEERKWPKHEEFVQAHNYIYYHGTTDTKGTETATHYDGTALDDEEKKHIGILRFTLGRDDAPIPDNGPAISDDDWWTICLPYTLSQKEVEEIFGTGTQLYGLQKVTRNYNTNRVLLSFTYNVFGDEDRKAPDGITYIYDGMKHGQLTAWLPYMIKPGKKLDTTTDGTKYMTFGTRVPEEGSEVTDYVQAILTGTGVSDNKDGNTEWYYVFRGNCSGTYTASDGSTTGKAYHRPDYCYFLGWDSEASKPAFYYQHAPSSQKVWSPYTCTVLAVKHTTGATTSETTGVDDSFSGTTPAASEAKATSLFGDDSDVTAIDQMEILTPDVATDGNIYNLQGTLVRQNALSTEGLPKGIYVSNGKKFVVK